MQAQEAPVEATPTPLTSLPEQVKYGNSAMLLKTSRTLTKFFPQNGGSYGPTKARTIRFDISSPQFLDLCNAKLVCNAQITIPTNNRGFLDGGLGGAIRRISIMNMAGQLIERIDDYNKIQALLKNIMQPNAFMVFGKNLWNYYKKMWRHKPYKKD